MANLMFPKYAIIAITLNCDARCVMCNIWKNKIKDELSPEEYRKLPTTLREINITGGEPFIRNDINEIVKNIKLACPKARLVISSNGHLIEKIESEMKKILKIDPNIALRISIDGTEEMHNKIRGMGYSYNRAMATIEKMKEIGVKDLGIGMTISSLNAHLLYDVFELSRKLGIEMTISVVIDSDIYFGQIDNKLKSYDFAVLEEQICRIAHKRLHSLRPKEWARAWFEGVLLDFIKDKKRPFRCNAGEGFFYMDSMGNIYSCPYIDNYIGNIKGVGSFEKLWNRPEREESARIAKDCEKCWMVCTSKSQISRRKIKIGVEILIKRITG